MLAPIKSFICTEDTPIVQTKAGKLRGMIVDDIYTFRGIRYAEAERFMSPKPVTPWEGVVNCQDYGYACPMPGIANPKGDINNPHCFWPASEHCQYLNVWTDTMDSSAKKPVMFWIHGGGFSTGSATDLWAYDGENLARDTGVVVVSLNHRLNMLGFIDLTEYGPEFAHSGIAGMEDIVEALRWVRDNIAQFGGDPDNVTLFGQSGGGGKIQVLMQMASADGLYHRVIIQSGILKLAPSSSAEEARQISRALVEQIGGIEALCTKSYAMLDEAARELQPDGFRSKWSPVPGCCDFIGTWDKVGFRPEVAHIPVIVGSAICEFADIPFGDKAAMTDAQRSAAIAAVYGEEHAEAIEAAFRKAYPGVNTFYASCADNVFRAPTLEYLEARSAAATAPVYGYMLAHEHAFYGGRMSCHGDDLPFVFRNDRAIGAVHHADPAKDDTLREEMSRSWVAFARTNDPNCDAIAEWKPYTSDCHATFVFWDNGSQTKIDYDAELVDLLVKYAPLPIYFQRKLENP